MVRIGELGAAVADLVLPRRCVGCGSTASVAGLCRSCRPADPPRRAWTGDPQTLAAASYDGPVRAALLAYKERGRRDLAGVLGELLASAVQATLAAQAERGPPVSVVVLVPVPSARAVAAARGGDHVLRLARRAGRRLGLPTVTPLALTRQVDDSAGLGAADRARNLAAAMAAASPRRPAPAAIVVDDIVTTGATLREASRALAAVGWPVLGRAVVATTPRRALPLARPRWAV